MYAFDYRQRLMETVERCCRDTLEAMVGGYPRGVSLPRERLTAYYALVAIALRAELAPLASRRGIDLDPLKMQLPAGAQYAICYWVVTGRSARPRDCQLLDERQAQLLARALTPPRT